MCMKKKKFKKIAKLVYDEMMLHQSAPKLIREKVDYVPFDSEVSTKTKKLILGLVSYNEGVNINFSDDEFIISTQDITNIKKKYSRNTLYSEENYLEICVSKEGFTINYAFKKRTNYEDKDMYNELIDIVKEKLKDINRENFTDIWSKVMQESGIMRDSNLEGLLEE